jgi:hypothetical protein
MVGEAPGMVAYLFLDFAAMWKGPPPAIPSIIAEGSLKGNRNAAKGCELHYFDIYQC